MNTNYGGASGSVLRREQRTRRLLQLRAVSVPSEGPDLAHLGALLPGTEIRRDAARGGDPAREEPDDRGADGALPETSAAPGLGDVEGRDHARGPAREIRAARGFEAAPARDRRAGDRRAHEVRPLLGRRRRRKRAQPPGRAADAAPCGIPGLIPPLGRLEIPVASVPACKYKIDSLWAGKTPFGAGLRDAEEVARSNGRRDGPVSPWQASLTAVQWR